MAVINTGLGWEADENYLKQYAGKIGEILSFSGLTEAPLATTQSDIVNAHCVISIFPTGTQEYIYLAGSDTPGTQIGVNINSQGAGTVYFANPDPSAKAYWVMGFRNNGQTSWTYLGVYTANINNPYDNYYVCTATSYPATVTESDIFAATEPDTIFNHLSYTAADINKANDGWAVVAWVIYKWEGGYGDVERTPILISTSPAAVEYSGLPSGVVPHSTMQYFQGAIFQMTELYNLEGASPFSIMTLDYSSNAYPEMDEAQLFARIANSVSLRVPVAPDPYGGGPSGPGGGGGGGIDDGTPVPHPNAPTISAADTGLVTLYVPTLTELQGLAQYLWSGLFDIDTFRKIFADPMDAILGLSILPIAVPAGSSAPIRIGNQNAGVSAARATGQYVTVSCGSLTIDNNIGCYLDCDPYTQLSMYLPYIGFVPLRADDCMGQVLNLQYIIDIFSGACVANLTAAGSVIGSWAGNCATQIPITSSNYNNVISGALSIAATAASLAAGATAITPAAVAGMANTAINSQKPTISRSGSLAGSAGFMGVQIPYIIATQPRPAIPGGQNQEIGYPSYINELLGSLHGFTIVDEIHLSGITGTQAEIDEIQQLLSGGVIL